MTNNEFAAEHRIFLHAILDLLTERDHLLALQAADGRHTNNSPQSSRLGIYARHRVESRDCGRQSLLKLEKAPFRILM
jgi:hypothetical protein